MKGSDFYYNLFKTYYSDFNASKNEIYLFFRWFYDAFNLIFPRGKNAFLELITLALNISLHHLMGNPYIKTKKQKEYKSIIIRTCNLMYTIKSFTSIKANLDKLMANSCNNIEFNYILENAFITCYIYYPFSIHQEHIFIRGICIEIYKITITYLK